MYLLYWNRWKMPMIFIFGETSHSKNFYAPDTPKILILRALPFNIDIYNMDAQLT